MRRQWAGIIVVTTLIAVSAAVGLAQRQSGSTQSQPTQSSSRTNFPTTGVPMGGMDPSAGIPDVLGGRMAEQQARTRNSERQKKLESDTQKLVGLVTDLKDQVQSDKQLSPADLSKRAEEIEKLARSVKDRMKG